jgi:YVTN family beta-propeller protein
VTVANDPRVGSELLGYRIEARIGRGGMSVVYRAEDLRLKRKVALKLLAPELAEDERFRERFLRESELAASLDHPHIVPIYDAGEHQGQLYIAMRYVEGSDLKRLLKEKGALEPRQAISLLEELADALDAAHARGLVHRDVKPSNALLDGSGHLYLSDFGLTKSASDRSALTMTGRIVGTVDYAAPEQIEGKPVDGRADVYSLGCLLYECLAGEVPFPRDSELAVLWAHVNEPPPKLPAYSALEPVIAKALAKDPQERYASCAELVEAARETLGLRDVLVVRDRRPLLFAAVGAALVIAAVLLSVLLTRGGGSARPSTKPTLAPKVDSLQRIDPATNGLAATIQVGPSPSAVAVGEGAVWVTSKDDRTVSRIDPGTNSVAKTGAAGAGPTALAVGAGVVWIANNVDWTLVRIDPESLAIQAAFQLPLDCYACGVAIGGGRLWATDASAILEFPLTSFGERVARIESPIGISALDNNIAVAEGAVWVIDDNGLTRIHPQSHRIAARIRGLEKAVPIVDAGGIAAGARAVWITNPLADTVSRIDRATNRVTRRIRVGDDPLGVAVGGGSVWVANHDDGTVSRIEPKTGRVAATIRVGPNPTRIAAGEGGVWVTVSPG